jgi:hypothetical protein
MNCLPKALLDKIGSRRIKLVIDQRLHLFDKLHGVRLLDVIIERGLIDPARVNVKQLWILVRTERVNAQTTRFLSRWRDDLAQRAVN